MSKKTVSLLTFFFLIILLSVLGLYIGTNNKIQRVEANTVNLINKDQQYKVVEVQDFYWVTLDKTYHSLVFLDESDHLIYAIYEEEGKQIHYFTSDELISKVDATSITKADLEVDKVMNTRLGMLDGQPVWEMVIQNPDESLTYYRIDARDGTWKQKIDGI